MALIRALSGSSGGGGFTETTLWSNSNPSANFSADDYSLSDDFRNYTYLKFVSNLSTSNTTKTYCIISVEDFLKCDRTLYANTYPLAWTGGCVGGYTYARYSAFFSANGYQKIFFHNAYAVTNSAVSNGYIIPVEIIGLK